MLHRAAIGDGHADSLALANVDDRTGYTAVEGPRLVLHPACNGHGAIGGDHVDVDARTSLKRRQARITRCGDRVAGDERERSDRGGGGYGGGRADVECAVQSTDQEERQNPDAGHGGNLYPPRQSGRRARQRCFAAPLGKATPTRPAPLDQVIEAIRTVTPATADADERNENQYV